MAQSNTTPCLCGGHKLKKRLERQPKDQELCDCASSVGTGRTSADTQYFVNEGMGVYLGVFKDGGAAAYEICEINGECHAYGDVNDGMVARRRRRRLLQAGSSGGS